MLIRPILAMTAAEFHSCEDFSGKIGWMSCLFSPYGTGLSNLPQRLPEGSLLVLSDYTPMQGHDPQVIEKQLCTCIDRFSCCGVLLDFQRTGNAQASALAASLVKALPCPVAVSAGYAKELDCPVFLPPVPPDTPLTEHIAPWTGREIWLELALDGQRIVLTQQGAEITPLPHWQGPAEGFAEEQLCCHYRIETTQDKAIFTLWRTREDLEKLLEEANELGITTAVALYQELGYIL